MHRDQRLQKLPKDPFRRAWRLLSNFSFAKTDTELTLSRQDCVWQPVLMQVMLLLA